MTGPPALTSQELNALREFDTCMIANAIETFHVRLRNTGFTDGKTQCRFPEMSPMVGYAVTGRLRSGDPPIAGESFHDRADLWNYILDCPVPRILVLQDMDDKPGRGAFVGDMHAAILRALGCIGYLSNGAVRELPRVRQIGFHLFAASVAVSHAYAHIFDLGAPVSIDGLDLETGTLLHGDQHGVVSIPAEIAGEIPEVAAKLRRSEQEVIDFCDSSEFSIASLAELINRTRT